MSFWLKILVTNPECIENRIFLGVDFVVFIKPFDNDINLILDLLMIYMLVTYVTHMTFVSHNIGSSSVRATKF